MSELSTRLRLNPSLSEQGFAQQTTSLAPTSKAYAEPAQQQLEAYLVHIRETLIAGLRAIERGGAEIAIVIDDARRLCGTLTDGDARRALLAGASLDSPLAPHVHSPCTYVNTRAGRAEVLELMQARWLGQIPVVDDNGRVVGIHLLHDLIGCVHRPNRTVIMAGGQGKRLQPLTETLPKSMLCVAGKPILERIVLHLVGQGLRHVVLAINHLGESIENHFGDGSSFGCHIEYLREEKALGTAGALSMLPPQTRPIVVMNGDLITQADIGSMLDFHEGGNHLITVATRRYMQQIPYGCVETEGRRVRALEEKPLMVRQINAGIYVLDPSVLGRIPHGKEFHMTALINHCLDSQDPVGAYEILSDWIDVGYPAQLKLAREGDL